MKRYDNGSNDLDHVSRLPRWIGIAGAIFLVILLKACSSFAGSRDFDARNRIQAHGTGPSAPAVGPNNSHSPFSLCAQSFNSSQVPAGQQTGFNSSSNEATFNK